MNLQLSNLDNVVVVSTDGSYFGLNTAFLVDTALLDEDQADSLNEGTDSERADLCNEVGIDLEHAIKNDPDNVLVKCVADVLWGDDSDTEWSADTLDAIAEAFRKYRPDLADLT